MRQKRTFPKIPMFLGFVTILMVVFVYRSYRMPSLGASFPSSDTLSGMILKDAVPAIDHPKFESVASADQYLNNDGLGIAVILNQDSRFYPYQILVWHHVVNDLFGSEPVLISYNPFAMSSAAYQRSVQGTVYDFGLSGTIANGNLLLYDREGDSLWDPMKHQAVDGGKKGTMLAREPSNVMTWNAYKHLHPDGRVLSKDTGFLRDYTHDPYGDYNFDARILFPVAHKDDRLASKELIYGIEWNQKQKAYPLSLFKKHVVINDKIDSTLISIEQDEKTGVVRAFQVDQTGTHQNEIPVTESFWFAWAAVFPGTLLYK